MLFACQRTEPSKSGIVIPTINGWNFEIQNEKAVAPPPLIIDMKKAAAQVGHPANKPKIPPVNPEARPEFLGFDARPLMGREILVDALLFRAVYSRETLSPTRKEITIIKIIEMGII